MSTLVLLDAYSILRTPYAGYRIWQESGESRMSSGPVEDTGYGAHRLGRGPQ